HNTCGTGRGWSSRSGGWTEGDSRRSASMLPHGHGVERGADHLFDALCLLAGDVEARALDEDEHVTAKLRQGNVKSRDQRPGRSLPSLTRRALTHETMVPIWYVRTSVCVVT